MPGGLMNLVSYGQQNVILNGNPSKTFFKSAYSQYTNFGLQKFRVDFEGSRTLRLTEESSFTFKIPRYADLLMDTYISFELPHIWSPVYMVDSNNNDTVPYEFRWIENLGAKMINKILITCGSQTLQEFSGDYLLAMVQRDYSSEKKNLFDKMTGNTPEINNPASVPYNVGLYPNAIYTNDVAGAEPSIRGRILYIPLNTWFMMGSQMAFPLTSLQYNELNITITFKPINELFRIKDVKDVSNNYPFIAPNFNSNYMQFYRFLQTPPSAIIDENTVYPDMRTLWNTDVHLNCTYCFLSTEEARIFALQEQKYLFKQVNEKHFYNVTGSQKVDLKSLGMVSSHLFYFQRSDVNLRNEWSNYTNWEYDYIPSGISVTNLNDLSRIEIAPLNKIFETGVYYPGNQKEILQSMGILLDGSYRENDQPVGVFNLIEKFIRTRGNAPDGLYCYNFCMNTNPHELQPSGAINMNRFNQVELEFTTNTPPLDPLAQTTTICDENGVIIGINKPTWRIYKYNYDLHVFEERINIITFIGGNCGLMYAT
jgi:Major capsid protein N-terminus/Large eukaryotic DNA virus major capsid protein